MRLYTEMPRFSDRPIRKGRCDQLNVFLVNPKTGGGPVHVTKPTVTPPR
jgi:hypothetical protein